MKRCPSCSRKLPETMFHSHANTKDGLTSYCKDCVRAYQQERTWQARPLALTMWYGIQQRCLNADGKHPAYANIHCAISKERFLEIVPPLISEYWKHNPGQRPSIDRRDPNLDYSEQNIRIISWWLNKKLARRSGQFRKPKGSAGVPALSKRSSAGFDATGGSLL